MDTFIYGIDFGTSNSAVTIWNAATQSVVADPRVAGVDASFLYFPYSFARMTPVIGNAARQRYVEDGMRGRFFQAIKTILPFTSFTETIINNQSYGIEDLIAIFIHHLKSRADAVTRQDVKRVILGRPAVFSADPTEDQLAEDRLRRAAELAGFTEIHFQFEPIAAAFAYESRIHQPERVLVGDFGGGTSDFTVVQLDPRRQKRTDRTTDILATGGLPVAGNKFDAATMWHKVTPLFGRGATYNSWGKQIDVPESLYRTICQWDQIVFLNNAKKMDFLWRLTGLSSDPAAFERFRALIKENQGFALFQVLEAAKIDLTGRTTTAIDFDHPQIPIHLRMTRSQFNRQTADLTAQITGYLDDFLAGVPIKPNDIETVFLTGGTSLIPKIRSEFVERFGAEKIRDGQEFTSVADGLALSAPLFFPELHG
ncbi:Hsp70 family protein [Synoicihabitans lomoniglobus]|uniref:Hsp70 family protein n=1 Tax=Synoicihabitans lomoniglobus TaxID=2909285 RepID=A0AAE9ZSW5_9BACT|nr:Hsp70 family protein [Opitutaceae bacterium LMO-M01]WED64605.1 Hsp70 family protein [Opitutaceae bacterium LMO-M01]